MIRKNLFFLVAYFTFSFAFAQEGINQEEINQNAETNQNSEQNLRQNLDKQLQTTRGSKNFKFYFDCTSLLSAWCRNITQSRISIIGI